MTEGYNCSIGCHLGCTGFSCGWVPYPKTQSRRYPLIDAVGRVDNPCDRPARLPPCCQPTPKFRAPREIPECDISQYREDMREAKMKEDWEQKEKFQETYPSSAQPEMITECLDQKNYPVAVELPLELPPEQKFFLKDGKCKTDIIAGFFNPDDNKDAYQLLREKCDPTFEFCGGSSLAQYPCRGVISFPPQVMVSEAEERRLCVMPGCEDSPFMDPNYIRKQQELKQEVTLRRLREKQAEYGKMANYTPRHPCCGPEKLSQTPYCTCNDLFCQPRSMTPKCRESGIKPRKQTH